MNISIIEFGVLGLVAYSSLLMLIITTVKEPPLGKSQSLIRSIYMIPGIVCCILLAGSGVVIYLDDSTTQTTSDSIYEVLDNTNTVVVLNSTVTETVAKSTSFTLENPVWITLHYMFALILFAFIFTQMLSLFLFKD